MYQLDTNICIAIINRNLKALTKFDLEYKKCQVSTIVMAELPEEALKYYNQALPISREVGNRSGEAATLNNIGLVYLVFYQFKPPRVTANP